MAVSVSRKEMCQLSGMWWDVGLGTHSSVPTKWPYIHLSGGRGRLRGHFGCFIVGLQSTFGKFCMAGNLTWVVNFPWWERMCTMYVKMTHWALLLSVVLGTRGWAKPVSLGVCSLVRAGLVTNKNVTGREEKFDEGEVQAAGLRKHPDGFLEEVLSS